MSPTNQASSCKPTFSQSKSIRQHHDTIRVIRVMRVIFCSHTWRSQRKHKIFTSYFYNCSFYQVTTIIFVNLLNNGTHSYLSRILFEKVKWLAIDTCAEKRQKKMGHMRKRTNIQFRQRIVHGLLFAI